MNVKLDRRLWLTADRKRVVEDGDPESAFLLGAPGHEISEAEAKRLGIVPRETLNDEADDETEAKERKKRPGTKVRQPDETKG